MTDYNEDGFWCPSYDCSPVKKPRFEKPKEKKHCQGTVPARRGRPPGKKSKISDKENAFSDVGCSKDKVLKKKQRRTCDKKIGSKVSVKSTRCDSDVLSSAGDSEGVDVSKQLSFNYPETKYQLELYIKRHIKLDIVNLYKETRGVNGWRFMRTPLSTCYSFDYNIISLNVTLLKTYEEEKNAYLKEWKDSQNVIRETLEHGSMSRVHKMMSKTYYDILIDLVASVESGKMIKDFQENVKDIISEYSKMGVVKTKLCFGGMGKSTCMDLEPVINANAISKLEVIKKYLDVAKKYAKVNVVRSITSIRGCGSCHSDLVDAEYSTNGLLVCRVCMAENCEVTQKIFHREDVSIRNKEEKEENFKKTINRYQGLQPNRPEGIVLDKIFAEMKELKIRTVRDENCCSHPRDDRGRCGCQTIKKLLQVINITSASKLYDDVHLIATIVYGWKPNELTRKEKEKILCDFRATQLVFDNIPKDLRARESSLSVWFRMWKHLQLIGHKCSYDDFKMPDRLTNSFINHEKLWKMMCDRCTDSSIRYISNEE